MTRKAALLTFALALTTLLFTSGCKKDREPNKILINFPVDVSQTVPPGEITRLKAILMRDALSSIVKIINAMDLENPNFTSLTSIGGMQYTYESPANPYHDLVVFTVQFKDESGGAIDPIAIRISSSSLKTAAVTASGGTGDTSFSVSIVISIEEIGNSLSQKKVTGTSTLSGKGYTMTFTLDPNGVNTNEEGLTAGDLTVTGTGPTTSVSLTLAYSSDHDLDGTINWEGQTGQIHLDNDGTGFVITNNTFIPIQ